MDSLSAYVPMDRRQAMVEGVALPERAWGTVLSADISGYTPLTEALVRELGRRRGADELTRHMNIVYSGLIDQVHRHRGSVVGFSGDAITCWFNDDGWQSTACALAMQAEMQRLANIKLPSGSTISLAAKVTVVGGPVRRFLVGEPDVQKVDVLAGATMDRLSAAESQAQSGEVVVDPRIVAILEEQVQILEWREDEEGSERFAVIDGLDTRVATNPWPVTPSSVLREEEMRSWVLPPVYERVKEGQGGFLAEIRPAVPLFLSFGGVDYDGDDAAGEKLDAFVRWVQHILARHEGFLLQLTTGDKGSYLYAAFGAPLAHDDDSARAVAAAIELRSPPLELDFITNVTIGVSQGRMRVGAYGSPARRTYGVLGDEANVAARLMVEAKAGQILVSQRVADASVHTHRFRDLGLVRVRGKQDPLPVLSVLGVRHSSLPRAAISFDTPLVGRAEEAAQLRGLLERVEVGEGHILHLQGVAGIGKSRLAAEMIEDALARRFRIAVGACHSTSREIVYHPWQQVFRALFDLADEPEMGEDKASWELHQISHVETIVKESHPDWLPRLPLLGDLLALPMSDTEITAALDRKLRQEALFALIGDLIQTWALAQPLLLLIDDAHWLDEASWELTLALARTIADVPVLLALIQRPTIDDGASLAPDLAQLPGYQPLHLHEVRPQDLIELVTSQLSGPIAPLAQSLIQIRTAGNPFFVEQLVQGMRETGKLCMGEDGVWALSPTMFDTLLGAGCLVKDPDHAHWVLASHALLPSGDLELPDTIQAAVLSRLDRLSDAHKVTLKTASVIGTVVEFDLLARSHPLEPDEKTLLNQLRNLSSQDHFNEAVPPPHLTHVFRHHITQEVAYDTLLEEQRRELHKAVGDALESLQHEEVERLAYHYSRSGVRDKALFYLDKAGGKARREYANETALNYYDQALALEGRWEWLRGKVEVLHILGRREDEQAVLKELEAVPEASRTEVSYLWGQYYEAVGEYGPAQTVLERALASCRAAGDKRGEVRCLSQLGLIARRQADYEVAKTRYGQALDLLEDDLTGQEIQVLNGLGTVYRAQGDFERARRCYGQALAKSRKIGNRIEEARAYHFLGGTAFFQRSFDEALDHYQQALAIRRLIGDRAGVATGLCSLAQIASSVGDYGQAEQYLDEALKIQESTGNRYEQVNVWNELGVLHLFVGALSKAQICLQQALAISQEIGDQEGMAYILGNLALVMRDQGELAAAEQLLGEGQALAQVQEDEFLISIFLSHLAIVKLRAGDLEQAIKLAQEALALRRKLDLGAWATTDLTTLAAAHMALDDTEQALEYAHQALVILDEGGAKEAEYPHQDYYICYQVLAASNDEEAARSALQSAHDLVTARAEQIADPVARLSFLEQVEIHRAILTEHGKHAE